MMRAGSLFSGIGGLELGLEMSGICETVWQVEQDERCRAVLAEHWPNAKRFDDVRRVGSATLAPVDLICGGFPCQDVSSAGKRVGLSGARSGLWFEFHRIVSELRPRWVVVENVASGARAWVDAVCEGLGELGYACLPIPLGAVDVGAPHRRNRIFIVATNADGDREHARAIDAEVAKSSTATPDVAGEPPRGDSGPERTLASADSLRVGSSQQPGRLGGTCGASASDAARNSGAAWGRAEPGMVRVVNGVPRGLDATNARIKALGNSVVPQCAEVVGHVIKQLERQVSA